MNKRKSTLWYIPVALLIVLSALISGCTSQEKAASNATPDTVFERPETVVSGTEAKKLLVEGNKRFTEAKPANIDLGSTRRKALLTGQKPFATIISCSDSRVPPELLFNQGLGDLFIIRNAGNIIEPVATGSVEYAVEHLQTPLIVVMGHQKCGAVTAAVEGGEAPGSIGVIIEKIAPAVIKAKVAESSKEEIIDKSINENIKASIAELKKSPIVKHALESGKLTIVGAKYHLDSGEVKWFNDEK